MKRLRTLKKINHPYYKWEDWQNDHFIEYGYFYEATGYDWETWVGDLFSESTEWEV